MKLTNRFNELLFLMNHPRAGSTEIGDEMHTCANCGHEYQGNFCPACGQKATAGRISWETVRSGVMDVWGLGSRSLLRSLWNLIVRPGSFISDYINGKWQVSFPPVKMLVIVALSLYFLGQLIYPEFWNDLFDNGYGSTVSSAANAIDAVMDWVVVHPEWSFLFLLSFLIIPTWFVFRHAPRNTSHTMPQGFFIQVFLSVQFYLWLFIFTSVFKLFGYGLDIANIIAFAIILPLLLFVDYKSLFGYGRWGTLWRVIVVFLLAYLGLLVLVFLSIIFDRSFLSVEGNASLLVLFFRFLCVIALIVPFIFVIDMINRKTWRTAGWIKALKYPLITLGVALSMVAVSELTKPGVFRKVIDLLFLN